MMYNIDIGKRPKYYCNKCKGNHYYDSNLGQIHLTQKRTSKQYIEDKAKEFEKKNKGRKVEMLRGSSYRMVILTGKRKPNYMEVKDVGWVHQSKIFFPGGKLQKKKKRYELKSNEKGFWEI